MIVITDTNIFYSALIAPNGEIATILKDRNMQFIAPDFIIEEVKEHLDVIKAGRRKDKAEKITKDIDVDDIPFIAFHLQYKHKI